MNKAAFELCFNKEAVKRDYKAGGGYFLYPNKLQIANRATNSNGTSLSLGFSLSRVSILKGLFYHNQGILNKNENF